LKTLIIGKNYAINIAISGLLKSDDYRDLNYIHLGENLTNDDIENISQASLVIIDLTSTTNNSKLFVQQIRQLNAKAIILALHIYHEPEFIAPIIEAGASAYLRLNTCSQEIETAIKLAQNEINGSAPDTQK
jgi:DNA-binding NarL/FixJ family response regulator